MFNGFLSFLLFIASGFIILLVLVQRGKGGGLTGALGGMGGQSAFGAKAGDVFTKITVASAAIWIVLCLITIRSYSYREVNKDNIGPFDVKKLFNADGSTIPAGAPAGEPVGLPTIGTSDDDESSDKAGDDKSAPPVPPSIEGNGKSAAGQDPAKTSDPEKTSDPKKTDAGK